MPCFCILLCFFLLFFAFFLHVFCFLICFFFLVAFLVYIFFTFFEEKNIPLFYRIWLEAVNITLHVWSGRYLIRIGLRLLSQLSAEKKDRDESGSHGMTDCVHHWQYIVSKLDGAPCARYHGPTKSLISCGHSLYPQRWIENNWHTWNISKGRRRFAARTQGGRCQCLATCYHAVRTVACHVPVFAYQSGLNNIIISCIIPILPTCHIIEAHHRTLVITRINPGASDWRATSAECSGGASFPKLKIDVSC